jgi:nucleoside-diphosphate kinase
MSERTLCIIKPDGVEKGYIGKIVDRIEQENFTILGMKRARLHRPTVEAFYAVHRERPFFGDLVEYMTSGPVVLIALERDGAVAHWREVIGATDPADAAEGTIRKLYGEDKGTNTVHGSDSPENGRIEISMFFSESELIEQR